MQALSSARTAVRAAAQARPATAAAARRGMATEPEIAWSEYRAGKATLQEWVDANRHKVAGGFFTFYVGLAAWNLRPTKGGKKQAAPEAVAEPAPEVVAEPAK